MLSITIHLIFTYKQSYYKIFTFQLRFKRFIVEKAKETNTNTATKSRRLRPHSYTEFKEEEKILCSSFRYEIRIALEYRLQMFVASVTQVRLLSPLVHFHINTEVKISSFCKQLLFRKFGWLNRS